MKSLFKYIFISFVVLAFAVVVRAEEQNKVRDSVNFGYSFQAGDTLIYRAVSTDSILVNYTNPLIKKRYEKYRVVCDSVSADKHFFINITMIEYVSYESQDKQKNIRNVSNPWLGRTAYIEIDRQGNRYSYAIDDSTRACNASGGAFQPYMFFPLGATLKAVKDSWLITSHEFLPENGSTIPDAGHSVLFMVKPNIDTLNHKCTHIQFEKTGRGRNHLITNDEQIAVSAILNGGGRIYLSKEYDVPVYFNYGQQQRIQMAVPNKPDVPVMHLQTTDWNLEKFNRIKEVKTKKKNK